MNPSCKKAYTLDPDSRKLPFPCGVQAVMGRRRARKGDDVFFSSPFPTYHSPAVRVMKTTDNGLVVIGIIFQILASGTAGVSL